MRLIDIDKHFELNEPFYKADIEMPLHRVKVALESLPTVQAIPIEWIENWKRGKSSIEQVVADKIMMDYKYRDYWEKENETN